MKIPQADIDDPQHRTYMSSGGAHGHMVDMTAAQFNALAASSMVTVSSSDTNAHTWMITCV